MYRGPSGITPEETEARDTYLAKTGKAYVGMFSNVRQGFMNALSGQSSDYSTADNAQFSGALNLLGHFLGIFEQGTISSKKMTSAQVAGFESNLSDLYSMVKDKRSWGTWQGVANIIKKAQNAGILQEDDAGELGLFTDEQSQVRRGILPIAETLLLARSNLGKGQKGKTFINKLGALFGLSSKELDDTFFNNIALNDKHQFVDEDAAVKALQNVGLTKITTKTLLIIVDTHKSSYVEAPGLLEKTNQIAVIDHHRRSTDFIKKSILTFHEVYASSAAELVTELLQYTQTETILTELEAEMLYAGIMMDTKNFTFKTGVRTFEAAAYLRKYGIDIIKVKKWFQSDLETYNTVTEIIKTTEIINNTIGIAVYEKEDKNANIICAKSADELLTIGNITASFVLGNDGEKINISGRSIGDINVQVILENMGGGGHITLAEAQIEGKTIEEVKAELIEKINEYFSESGQ